MCEAPARLASLPRFLPLAKQSPPIRCADCCGSGCKAAIGDNWGSLQATATGATKEDTVAYLYLIEVNGYFTGQCDLRDSLD
jgi:hypothetical protein